MRRVVHVLGVPLLVVGTFGIPQTLQAQARVVGTVEKVRDLETDEAPTLTSRAQATPVGENSWQDLIRDAQLVDGREVRVSRLLNLRVAVDDGRAKGRLIFTTDLIGELSDDQRVLANQRVDSSRYIVEQGSAGPEVEVLEGTLVVDWQGGELTVIAAGRRMPIRGTEVAFHVFPGGDSALVYMDAGAMTFEGPDGFQAAPRTVYMVRRQPAAILLESQNPLLSQAELALWHEAIDVHARKVWARASFLGVSWPWWGAVGVVGGIACVVTECWTAFTGPGTVGVRLRLPF